MKDQIIIPKKAFLPMMCLVPLIAIILSKRDVGALVLLIVGVSAGIFIGRGFWKKDEKEKRKKVN